MIKTKTKISLQVKRKRNPEVVETINAAKNNEKWIEVASLLTYPRRKRISLNLSELDRLVKDKETIIVPGKILSQGNITKSVKISALDFSEGAKQKLKESKTEFNTLMEEIKKNPSATGIRILK